MEKKRELYPHPVPQQPLCCWAPAGREVPQPRQPRAWSSVSRLGGRCVGTQGASPTSSQPQREEKQLTAVDTFGLPCPWFASQHLLPSSCPSTFCFLLISLLASGFDSDPPRLWKAEHLSFSSEGCFLPWIQLFSYISDFLLRSPDQSSRPLLPLHGLPGQSRLFLCFTCHLPDDDGSQIASSSPRPSPEPRTPHLFTRHFHLLF